MNKNTYTIFQQLVIFVIVPVITIFILLGILNYLHTKKILENSHQNKNFIITDEIRGMLEFQDIALKGIENKLDERISKISNELVTDYFYNTKKITSLDLDKIRLDVGMDPNLEDIYLINVQTGQIENTTFKNDLNVNVFNFGEKFKSFLLSVINKDDITSERFSIELTTNRNKKYTYQATKDKKYIIEIGIYSEEADKIMNSVKNRLKYISLIDTSIVYIDLFIGADNPFSLITGKTLSDNSKEKKYLSKTFKEKSKQSFIDTSNNNLLIEFFHMERKNTKLYKNSVVKIITDKTGEKVSLRSNLHRSLFIFGITIIIVFILIYWITKGVTFPIKNLAKKVVQISQGNYNERAIVEGSKEVATLSEKFNHMIETIESYTNDLGKKVKERTIKISNQKEEIEKQRDNLSEKNESLTKAYDEIEEKNQRIQFQIENELKQRDYIIRKNKEMMADIRYASRIQHAILPQLEDIHESFHEYFILHQPKKHVSGDFYWFSRKDSKKIFAVGDCTGHGVSGALMHMLGNAYLNEIVARNEYKTASDILEQLRDYIMSSLNQTGESGEAQDGMDIALCIIDCENNSLEYAGANNPIYIIRDNELSEFRGDRMPVGIHINYSKPYTNHVINLESNDQIYLFSDGFADQFGGPNGKKFRYKQFKELLLKNSHEPMSIQKEILNNVHDKWRGQLEQIDDILVFGLKIK